MLFVFFSVSLLTVLHSGVAQTTENGGIISQAATLAPQSAVLKINVDNAYVFYWNGELVERGYDWQQMAVYYLVPVPICNYPNVLAINATDYGVIAGVIMQLEYSGVTYKMGSSPEILLTNAYSSDPAWYMKSFSDPTVWASSNTLASCDMVETQMQIQHDNYEPGTYWRWFRNCNETDKSVFVKLVVYTRLRCCSYEV